MKRIFTSIIITFALGAQAQTLYVPSGTTGIGLSSNGNVGIGTTSTPAEKLHVAGNLQIGNNAAYTIGSYEINMPQGSGTINNGDGRNLTISAGSSDNQSSVKGGLLILRPGNPTSPSTNYGHVVIADNGGNVGVGTASPQWKLDVNGQIASRGQAVLDAGATEILIGDIAGGDGLRDKLSFYTRDTRRMTLDENGNLGIGTINSDYKLTVNGKIKAEEVQVVVDVPADYVFEKDYSLMPLTEVEKYVTENKHLPGMPNAESLITNGWQVGEMNNKLLEKVEELTLYMIQLKKENEELKKRVTKMESKK